MGSFSISAVAGLLFLVSCVVEGERKGRARETPNPVKRISPIDSIDKPENTCEGDCQSIAADHADQCSWSIPDYDQFLYSAVELHNIVFESTLPNPRGAKLAVVACGDRGVTCGGSGGGSNRVKGCITVPGVKPTITGRTGSVRSIIDGLPSSGFQLVLSDGETCEVNGKPRETILTFPCDPTKPLKDYTKIQPLESYEGKKQDICHYYMMFPKNQLGCPLYRPSLVDSAHPIIITAVSGCIDSSPMKTTHNCPSSGKQTLIIHTMGIEYLCPTHNDHAPSSPDDITNNHRVQLNLNTKSCSDHLDTSYCILVGESQCTDLTILDMYTLTCTMDAIASDTTTTDDDRLSVRIIRQQQQQRNGDTRSGLRCVVKDSEAVAVLSDAVSFKKAVDFHKQFNQFVDYGVGGLKKEIDELYRRAFASRGVSDDMLVKLGISHVKGILLYGPPGTGKTLLARTIAKILGSSQVQLINGPEIVSKYLGESERNLRDYFKAARDVFSDDLYVIIIDEIDAICRQRGKRDDSAAGVAYDSLVNQLLTLMDGLSSSEASNTLVIGMTNRKELLDPALLRPGRFEVQIELKLPDEEGRLEIFQIHTRQMSGSGLLSDDINLPELAANTSGYNGAEIAGCVRAASSYALERQQSANGLESLGSVRITSADFQRALKATPPAHTHTESTISSQFLPPVFHHLGQAHDKVITSLLELTRSTHHNTFNRMQTALLYGPRGTGKTSLAAQIAIVGQFDMVKIITASSLIGLPDIQKVDIVRTAFTEAMKVKTSLIILDDLHRLLEYVLINAQVSISHPMMHVVTTMLSTTPPKTSSVLVIGTMVANSLPVLMDDTNGLGLHRLFSWHYNVPPMTKGAANEFLSVRRILNTDSNGMLALPGYVDSITVKHLIQSLECAMVDSAHSDSAPLLSPVYIHPKRFSECLSMILMRKQDVYAKSSYTE